MSKLVATTVSLKPAERAELLYKSDILESAHQSAATEGTSAAPAASDDIDLHFVCFVKSEKNHLWELDGRRKGPINRGFVSPEDDVLSEKALALGVKKFLNREKDAGGGDLRFSIIVLSPTLD